MGSQLCSPSAEQIKHIRLLSLLTADKTRNTSQKNWNMSCLAVGYSHFSLARYWNNNYYWEMHFLSRLQVMEKCVMLFKNPLYPPLWSHREMELHGLENKGAAAPKLLFELLTQERDWKTKRVKGNKLLDESGQWCCQATAVTLWFACPDPTGLGPPWMSVSSGQILGNCRTPGCFPLLPSCAPRGIKGSAFANTQSRESKASSVRLGSAPLPWLCWRRAPTPHPSKTWDPLD